MMHGSPLGIRKTIQLMIVLTILAWATQTLLAQWGFGADLSPSPGAAASGEAFVPAADAVPAGTLEVRSEATIVGTEVKLKQVCRWSDKDNATFAPIADLVVVRLSPDKSFQGVGVAEIKNLLHDAGVSLASINFAGSTVCTIDRSDLQVDEQAALQQWIDAHRPSSAPAAQETAPAIPALSRQAAPDPESAEQAAAHAAGPTLDPAAPTGEAGAVAQPFHTMRDLLLSDLATRLSVPADSLQVNFNPKDEKTLALSEPHFRFQIAPTRAKNLGSVSWDVTILADAGASQRISISAIARAWQNQVVLTRPVAMRQVIQEADILEKRVLVDRLDDATLLTKPQVIGNQAARDLKPGTIMTGKLVEPVPLARPGQFITVTVVSGSVKVKTVARAMEGGTFGQAIRVKNEATKDIYEVILTGPQTGEMSAGGKSIVPAKVATIRGD